jgi:LAGLIDADG DNA endonuclease family protein
MLGDAYLQDNSNSTEYRLRFEWGEINHAYAIHIYELFQLFCLSEPRMQVRTNYLGNQVITWPFQTVYPSSFNILAELFLVKGRKTVQVNQLWDYFSPVSMAYWYIDDGELHKGLMELHLILKDSYLLK